MPALSVGVVSLVSHRFATSGVVALQFRGNLSCFCGVPYLILICILIRMKVFSYTLTLALAASIFCPSANAQKEEVFVDSTAMVETSVAAPEVPSFLFVQSAESFSFDRSTQMLTLNKISPSVIFFTDRPYRLAGHVVLPKFVQLWKEGEDNFAEDHPNASISIFTEDETQTVVVELANPVFTEGELSYRVVNTLEGQLPDAGGVCSIFIDGLFENEDGNPNSATKGGVIGSIGGALIGSISGHAGEGAAIGAGVGLVGGLFKDHKDHEEKQAAENSAAEEAAMTRVVNVPNPNGSYTPVTLHLVSGGWQGPHGEIYPTLPTPEQLSPVYGVN
jgi:hypothetical protein